MGSGTVVDTDDLWERPRATASGEERCWGDDMGGDAVVRMESEGCDGATAEGGEDVGDCGTSMSMSSSKTGSGCE